MKHQATFKRHHSRCAGAHSVWSAQKNGCGWIEAKEYLLAAPHFPSTNHGEHCGSHYGCRQPAKNSEAALNDKWAHDVLPHRHAHHHSHDRHSRPGPSFCQSDRSFGVAAFWSAMITWDASLTADKRCSRSRRGTVCSSSHIGKATLSSMDTKCVQACVRHCRVTPEQPKPDRYNHLFEDVNKYH